MSSSSAEAGLAAPASDFSLNLGHRDQPSQAVSSQRPPEPAPPQPAAAAIRGNRRSKIYYRSDCPGYGRIATANRIVFADAAAAQAAGFRRAGNCP